MKLSKQQSQAIYNLIHNEINSINNKRFKEADKKNEKAIQESVEKFKKTKEYEAIEMLSNRFKKLKLTKYSNKATIEYLATEMFKPKTISAFLHYKNERDTIELLAIDCKTLTELKQKINIHYSLKKKLA